MRHYLKTLRTEKGFTQAVVAQKLDISESYYSLIESGERQKSISLDLISKLSKVFGVSENKLIEDEKKYTSTPSEI